MLSSLVVAIPQRSVLMALGHCCYVGGTCLSSTCACVLSPAHARTVHSFVGSFSG